MSSRQTTAAVVAAVIFGVLTAPLARADDDFYLAAGYGVTGFETRCRGDACDRRDSGFRVEAGWQFTHHWSVEALYLNPGTFVTSDVTADGTPFHGRAHIHAVGATGGYTLDLSDAFSLTARAGVASVKAEFTPGPAPAIAGGKTTAQYLGGLSATWHITHALSARLDWDATRAKMNRYTGDVNAIGVGVQFGF